MEIGEEDADSDVTAGASFTLHVFARAILALNRVGNELYMEPSNFGLALRSLSCSKSAFGTFMFSKSFFSECDVVRLDPNAHNVCRIPMKCALSAFKCVKNSEKAVLSCQLYLNPRADTMLIQLKHTYDVMRYHKIPFFECTTKFRTVVDKAKLINCFVIQARLLLELFNRMHHNTDEILIDAKVEEISFRNYITHEQDRDMVMKTEGKIPIAEFQRYRVQRPAEITVNLKELRAIVNFADVHQSSVSIYFDQPGTPIVIALEDDINYSAEVILATAVEDTEIGDINPEVSVQITHVPIDERKLKRRRSHCSLNSHIPEKLIADCTKERVTEASGMRNNESNEVWNEAENSQFVMGLPQAASSPISETQLKKGIDGALALVENTVVQDDVMDTENNILETPKTVADVDGVRSSGSESPPSRGPALFRYLFALDEPTFDSTEFLRDAEVLASDSGSEISDRGPEQYIFDSDSELNV
uniref:Cell cycle checkpoint control protein RAD9A n=1 Tax=Setaria digitata TaxID=48799 RepID=A0A915PIG0_9BILA